MWRAPPDDETAGVAGAGARDAMGLKRCWLWWSSGKDAAWALRRLRDDPDRTVERLVTTVIDRRDRASGHDLAMEVVRAQARAVGLPLVEVPIAEGASNLRYEAAVAPVLGEASASGVQEMSFGDLHLTDIRDYRRSLLEGTGLEAGFPLWTNDTERLALEMIDGGLKARVIAVDTVRVSSALLGRRWDRAFLSLLDPDVDRCGERGEFHTCVIDSPDFVEPLRVVPTERHERRGILYEGLRLESVMSSTLLWVMAGARRQTLALLRSIDPNVACSQMDTVEHHPAWVAGHLLAGDLYLLHLLGAAPLPDDFPALIDRYGPGAEPVSRAGAYPPFPEVVERLADTGRRRVRAVSDASTADLERPLPDALMATSQPTIGHHLQAIVFHEGYHAGGIVAWRRRRGLPAEPWVFAPKEG